MIVNIIAILNLLVFIGLLYVIKSVIDQPYVLHRHPYVRNPSIRFSFIIILVSRLGVAVQPEWYYVCTATFNIGMLIAILFLAYLHHKNTLRINDFISRND